MRHLLLTSHRPFLRSNSLSHLLITRLKMSTSCELKMPSSEPVFSSNTGAAQAAEDLKSLLKTGGQGGRWSLIETGKGIERNFKFKTFKKTWEFMNLIAAECAVQKHHPEWSNVYNTTFIRWTTHSPSGLSHKDILMARFCDLKAGECGEVIPPEESLAASGAASAGAGSSGGSSEGGIGKELADRVATEGAECCVPKRK